MGKKAFDATTTAAAQLFGNSGESREKAAKTQKNAITETIPSAPPIDTTPKAVAQIPTPPKADDTSFSWKARPDAERRDRRLAITCKRSIAAKMATLARAKGYSLNYYFELMVLDQWAKEHPEE